MIKNILSSLALMTMMTIPSQAQDKLTKAYLEKKDTLQTLIKEKTTVYSAINVKKVKAVDDRIDFYFNDNLIDIPWDKESYQWLRHTLRELLPADHACCQIGNIYSKNINLYDLLVPILKNDGKPQSTRWQTNDPRGQHEPLVENLSVPYYNEGLSGRYIAIWQSHGKYYEPSCKRWEWQRAPNFTTVEDTYTQSYVLPFLIPMLENAGAYVMTPRERDTQRHEVIVDNDPTFAGKRDGLLRKTGKYSENGKWESAGEGFADAKKIYTGVDNPFKMGTARMAKCSKNEGTASATWTPDIPADGKYAVYISYKTLKNSTRSAHYTVRHAAGETEFIVNQRMGGGTWIYLGTFDFNKGKEACVTLDNGTPEGRKYVRGSVVTCDGIKIGGGMGKIARGNMEDPVETHQISGLPSYLEGALYSMQWAGIDSCIIRKFGENDYTNDYGTRGSWVDFMSRGSDVNPVIEDKKKEKGKKDFESLPGKGIPFDLSFAFHTDAGTTPNDSIIGTLSIYTMLRDGQRTFPDGEDRLTCRDYASIVQSQIVSDVRQQFNPDWSRRFLWDRSYSESRTPSVPAMLLELLSHQNFADMKFGLDPTFRFTVSRAIYKGMLKYLSGRYGCDYTVQPLPVNSFAVKMEGNNAILSWKATPDTLETTANPTGYILYTRKNDGCFDQGRIIAHPEQNGDFLSTRVTLSRGDISSFKIVAFNEGGKSFPSEILCAGIPDNPVSDQQVLVVNNFTRLSSPAWFDTPQYAGLLPDLDRGVSAGNEILYIGKMYQFRRDLPWIDDDNPGYGASYINEEGTQYVGNTFDYPYIHGKAIMDAGYPFCSASSKAFAEEPSVGEGFWTVDLICGKQITTMVGCGKVPAKYQVFPTSLQNSIKEYTRQGGNILISGANIGTDAWQTIYPMEVDSSYRADTQHFIQKVLGYSWRTNYASKTAQVKPIDCPAIGLSVLNSPISYTSEPNEHIYNVETPDGIIPAGKRAYSFMRYTDTEISAAVCFDGEGYKVVSLGFPIETLEKEKDIRHIIQTALGYFNLPPKEECVE